MSFPHVLMDLLLETAPWLLLGLFSAGVVKFFLPEQMVSRWLGGDGVVPIVRGALVGTPLPLCSCGVIPMAMGLRRQGASKGATVSFLVATPETGVDSVAISWAMLGPALTIARPIAAVISAVVSGMLVLWTEGMAGNKSEEVGLPILPVGQPRSSCCQSGCADSPRSPIDASTSWTLGQRLRAGFFYATHDLWDDLVVWLMGGLLVTAMVMTWVPPDTLHGHFASDWLSMLIMVVASVPVYVCATASTPLAAAMLYSGLTPGMALAFMIAGPATNLATLAIVRKELGTVTLMAYLVGIIGSAMILGLLMDRLSPFFGVETLLPLSSHLEEIIPIWLSWGSVLILMGMTLDSLIRQTRRQIN
ncbi:MAG: SO_0444 family Cu/Zn efflux transporter [Magnetococcus sp. THC-1_WYH]